MNGMNHPLQQMLAQMSGQPTQQIPAAQMAPMFSGIPQFANPMQKMAYVMQAMRNPVAFVKQHMPGIPDEVLRDPTGNSALQYMQQNMGVTQQDIAYAQNQIPQYQQMYNHF